MKRSPLSQLPQFGQSIWVDHLSREMIRSGQLARLIEDDGLRGLTSNPAIFQKAITGSDDYDEEIHALVLTGASAHEIYETIATEDVQSAADLLRPLYESSQGRHGFVSLEVSPQMARDTSGTIAEAQRLWQRVNRENVMIKVPGTREGLSAIGHLLTEGINVNITLLFGLPRYRDVAETYLSALETRVARGESVDRLASVASFFLSRIDVLVDSLLESIQETDREQAQTAHMLRGEVAIASARKAYRIYQELFHGARFARLQELGARPQRVLWASTSTKDPQYSDIKYVEALIGPETVNTLPLETLDAYRDHGHPAARLEQPPERADEVFRRLASLGIDIDQVTQQLENEGIEKFSKPFDLLMEALEHRRAIVVNRAVNAQRLRLGNDEETVQVRLGELNLQQFGPRLWQRDAALWKTDPREQQRIQQALGWLDAPKRMKAELAAMTQLTSEVRSAGMRHVVLLGMGGSSLTALVLQRSFWPSDDGMALTVLDTTDPATILATQRLVNLNEALFIVATKSGTTVEARMLENYFYEQVRQVSGDSVGEHFIAITDPASPLVEWGQQRGYRRVITSFSDVGGRFSALTHFGLVPAALLGVGAEGLLIRAERMERASGRDTLTKENPAVELGSALGALALRGRDKVTFVVPPTLSAFGLWLEQLLAESTGKEGRGIIPIVDEPIGSPEVYADDRCFVAFRLEGEDDPEANEPWQALEAAGHPTITIELEKPLDLAQEFFRWEVATAAAAAVLGVNPFDQPQVQESKENTSRLLSRIQQGNNLTDEEPAVTEAPLQLYGGRRANSASESLAQFLAQASPGDYLAIMGYLTESREVDRMLRDLRARLRDSLQLATTFGYGPRFLHSTGQLHKGGPPSGLFLQLTADDSQDVPIPGQGFGFSALKRAQAASDLQTLRRQGRRVLRVHLGADAQQGLAALSDAMETALSEHGVRRH